MEKQFLEMDMDPTSLICVNPYDVNPVMEKAIPLPTISVDVPLKGNASFTDRNWSTPYGGGSYGPQRKIKLEMEEFSDLSSFLPKPTSTNSIDELNTPIFDKDAFDFNVNVYSKDSQSEESFIKLESDVSYENACIISDNGPFKNFSLNTEKVQRDGNITSEIANNPHNYDINNYSPQSGSISAYNCKISPSYDNSNTHVYNVDDNSVLSVNSRHVSNMSFSNEDARHIQDVLETPEDSNSSSISDGQPRLAVNTHLKPLNPIQLDTPSILQEVAEMEATNFNILDLVGNEEISYVSSEDIFATPSSVSSSVASKSLDPRRYLPQKRPRKRKTYSDDDEDYVPPMKRNIVQRRTIIERTSESESDSDIDVDQKPKSRPRGRPPKRRTDSVSSDGSKDGDASKYRELRDKNNEASRKSRLKRKVKELELEKEADDLISRNIKLKAQVEELEKMVTNFRDNLFKIMIKK